VLPIGMVSIVVSLLMNPLVAKWLGWFQTDHAANPQETAPVLEPAGAGRSFAGRLLDFALWPTSVVSALTGLAALTLAIWTGSDVFRGVQMFSSLYEESRYSVLAGFADGTALLLLAIAGLTFALASNPSAALRLRIVGSSTRRVFLGFVALICAVLAVQVQVHRNDLVDLVSRVSGLNYIVTEMPDSGSSPTDEVAPSASDSKAPAGWSPDEQAAFDEAVAAHRAEVKARQDCANIPEKPEVAVSGCTTLISTDPTNAGAFYNRGTAYMILKQYDKARDDFSEAIRLDPTMARAFARRCLARFNRKSDYVVAVPDCNEAIRLAPKDYLGFYFRGILNLESGRHHEAIADLTMTIQLDQPDNKFKVGYIERGDAYALIGSNDNARADWKIACAQGVKDACDVK
jgi:tetratricopeptide (TPR) repeat protein